MSELVEPPKLDKCICGGEGAFNFERTPETRITMFWIQCTACGVKGSRSFPSSQEAAIDWNTKPENFPRHLYGIIDESN